MVPEGWTVVEAQEICESISVGVVIKPSQYYVDESMGIKAFRSANVREGFINDSDWVYFSQEGHFANKKSHLKSGDVLIVRTGYPGTACVVTPKFEGTNAIDIVIARPQKDKVLPEYLCAYTNSSFGKSQVLSLQGGMAQKHLNVGAYQTLKLKLPPLSEQRKISQILSTWDKAITTAEQLLTNSQQQKKALMQQLIAGGKRFPEFKRRWENRTLSEICILSAGQAAPQKEKYFINGSHDFIRVSDLGSNTSRWAPQSRDKVNQLAIRECKLEVVPAKATLFTKSGASLLLNQRAQLKENSFIVSHLGFAKAKDGVSDDFVFYLMCSIDFNRYAAGTSLPALQLSVLKSLKVFLPPYEEQEKIASMLSDSDTEISILEKKLFLLKQEKKALMQQLLTGKRRVKAEAA
ncbi:restriction endonuclease subunit S [Serratia ureilytica]|uniref:restriction endonuclease subunit S n=1 Tax=Serratia ureilytica TaxID=300181 RepID=UPI001D17F876|nr:restriction endonuclease subunit S [Serratia ureilytica]MCC4106869.1 restriction endonuclease subunit S [Serratia ureilytica]